MQTDLASRVERLNALLTAGSYPRTWIVALLMIVIVGILDSITGVEVALSLFYELPILFATWNLGRRIGIVFCVICAVTWLVLDMLGGQKYSDNLIPFWNMFIRFGYFLLAALLLSELKGHLLRERQMARTDELTRLMNRRGFFQALENELRRAENPAQPFTLAYFDLDAFKAVNDRYGHQAGDAVLRTVAEIMREQLRASDIAGRLGGDEFAILLPGTDENTAAQRLARLRDALLHAMNDQGWPVSVSMGATTWLRRPESAAAALRRVDALMYEVKQSGKNALHMATVER